MRTHLGDVILELRDCSLEQLALITAVHLKSSAGHPLRMSEDWERISVGWRVDVEPIGGGSGGSNIHRTTQGAARQFQIVQGGSEKARWRVESHDFDDNHDRPVPQTYRYPL
ncbi:hypothetical protein BDV93DRAFT_508740 [Ceratobasidium sp. AG-I]|nr:hypothetical protein BDV93DRAFT_508740 [Ceratobasidium sp. AG-I]